MSDDEALFLDVIRFNIKDDKTGELRPIEVDTLTSFILIDTAKRRGTQQAVRILLFGARIVRPDITEDQQDRMRHIIEALERSIISQHHDLKSYALETTYRFLYNKQIDRVQAAAFAESLLDREFSVDAWRKAVDRWAEQNGRDKIRVYNRRSVANLDKT